MAPFITHFLVAEKVWPEIKTQLSWPEPDNYLYYGQFCFGCVAPDVDKVSATLTQKDTHFFDRTTAWDLMSTHRSATFINRQTDFLYRPFLRLTPEEQAFALGYLCHLCVDEVSKYLWRYATWQAFKGIPPAMAFAALDERAKAYLGDYSAVKQAVLSIAPLESVIPVIPIISGEDWAAYYNGVADFVQSGATEQEILALVNMFIRPSAETRDEHLREFKATINIARQQVHVFDLNTMLVAAVHRTKQRIGDLLSRSISEPGLPEITRLHTLTHET